MPAKQFVLEGIGEVNLYKRRGTKGIRISLSATKGVRVTLPLWLPYKTGLQFVESRREWIEKNRPERRKVLEDGLRIGKAHRLYFVATGASGQRTSGRLVQNEARVSHPATVLPSDSGPQLAAERLIIKALTKEAESLLPKRLEDLAKKHGFIYSAVSVKRLNSRWGSCNQKKEITLNCFLMQLPWELIDYVLMHELVHTRVLRHGQPFWDELNKYIPNLTEVRKVMRSHQPSFA